MNMLGDAPNVSMLADGPADGTAKIKLNSLAGNVLAELEATVSITIGDLKAKFMPHVAPPGSKNLVLSLFFDGASLEYSQTLKGLGVAAGDAMTFLALLYDAELLAQGQRDQMYADAVLRSRQEAEVLRKARAARRQILAEQRQRAQEEQPSGEPQPILMLAEGPANPSPSSGPAAGPANPSAGGQHAPDEAPDAPLLMLAAEPANPVPSAAPQELSAEEKEYAARMAVAHAAIQRVKATHEVEAAYNNFFEHISFRKGWRELPFRQDEVQDAFKIAARVVVTIRLEVLNPREGEGIKLRQVDGSARDWMHDPAAAQLLRADPRKFPAALVHATFRDGRGYVEGLSEREVDGFLEMYV